MDGIAEIISFEIAYKFTITNTSTPTGQLIINNQMLQIALQPEHNIPFPHSFPTFSVCSV